MKVDILAFGAHADDVEISASGTLLSHISLGYTASIVDLTRGELGTRGSVELRASEAAKAAELLGVSARYNLGLEDGFFEDNKESLMAVIQIIRATQPAIVFAPAPHDRHPDHGRAAQLVSKAVFLSGLRKIETAFNDNVQQAWRPTKVWHYVQFYNLTPDILVDISGFINRKMEVVKAFASQFYNPESPEPETPISSLQFLHSIENRSADYGRLIGVSHAEAFIKSADIGVRNLFDVL